MKKKREGIVTRPMKQRAMMARGLFRRILLGMADDIAVECMCCERLCQLFVNRRRGERVGVRE